MARFARVLSVTKSSSTAIAEPPEEAVNLESDFVVIMAALLCALICVVGLIAVARCAWLRRSTDSTPTTTNSRGASARSSSRSAANKGLKKKVLQSLPKFTYTTATATTPDSNTKFASSECAICLGEFAEGEEIRVLPQCGHGFHVGCIDTWLGSHSSCPSCRQILVVAKCQKCGQAELKARQQDHVIVNNDTNSTTSNSDNINSNVSGGSSNVHVVTFLP